MQIKVILEYDNKAQSLSATCPELNFISSCGETKKEAIDNLKEAIHLLLEPIPNDLVKMNHSLEMVSLSI
ncbi:type II toxin-antitoxin system HicB family antitoxin [Chroococcus sp. FPU101]|uniref:type II toxin-antitoxin system HicB family antitoxin n=1 Tax=Chroococcus sp. FPU101 TaxID=1974212 RepID=UPI001A8D4BD8|nr:type II toxin-antitoxin system HicB family antitoxin [Chroococcus sp. FPU101]GFE69685.1 hypothetical protein CFPU101_22950 [Chroococcus sp. FPU101]